MIIIKTKRLYLRELVPTDKTELAKVLSDPESMQYYPAPFTDTKVDNWINWNIENYCKYQHGLWAVIKKDGDEFIGDCGITMQDINGEIVPEIGFHIIKEFCNQGYATEAAQACKEYAFEVLKYPKVYSYTIEQNIPSQGVAKKIGLKFEKSYSESGETHIVHAAIKND
ncbi:MAG: GNAT family N-acetyltransferase [Streptococcaceae bacterium]|jgi:RimJ/RimL family protein N-acetyltransferase|nr:GNAT family N-acetyltransferase [Streptococcaceae bacterium]